MASPGGPWGWRAVGRAWDTGRGLCPVPEGRGVCAGCFLSRDLGNSVGMGTVTSPDKGQVALGTHGPPVPIPAACQPSRQLCATAEQCCRFAGTLTCPLGFSSCWAGWSGGQRVAFAQPGQAVTPQVLQGPTPNSLSACGPGHGAALIQQISPGISTGGALLGAPPSLQTLLGSAAQPWPEANACAGQGLPALGASGRAQGQTGSGGDGTRVGDPRLPPRALPETVHPSQVGPCGAWEPATPSLYQGASHLSTG